VEQPLAEEGVDLRQRGLADAIIVTGAATGTPADPSQLVSLRDALPDCPLLVGSGITRENLVDFWGLADGFIVGTSLQAGQAGGEVQPDEVAQLVACLRRMQAI
jgi:predicted TIM-barrel enzyme